MAQTFTSQHRQGFTARGHRLAAILLVALTSGPGCVGRQGLFDVDAPSAFEGRPVCRGAFRVGANLGVLAGVATAPLTVPAGALVGGSDGAVLLPLVSTYGLSHGFAYLTAAPFYVVGSVLLAPVRAIRRWQTSRIAAPPPPPPATWHPPRLPVARDEGPVVPWQPPRGNGPPRLQLRAAPVPAPAPATSDTRSQWCEPTPLQRELIELADPTTTRSR